MATKTIFLYNFTSLSVFVGGNVNGSHSGLYFGDKITSASSISQIYGLFKQSPKEQVLNPSISQTKQILLRENSQKSTYLKN